MIKHTCLITGCDLFVSDERKTLHGDLHLLGHAYIFNGVRGSNGEANWTYRHDYPAITSTRVITVPDADAYFERHGIVVVDVEDAELNDVAKDFLLRSR